MSIKTLRKRIALVAVSALGVGLLSVAPASAADTALYLGANSSMATMSATKASNTSTGLISGSGDISATDTAIMLSTGTLGLHSTAGDGISVLTVSGGQIVQASGAAVTTAITLNAAGTIAGTASTAVGQYQVKPNAGVTSLTIKLYDNATAATSTSGGTLVATLVVTVKASTSVGTLSASDSFAQVVATAAAAEVTSSADTASALRVANGSEGIIALTIHDENDVAMPSTTVVNASATGGAVVAFSSAAQIGTSASTTYGSNDYLNIYVAQGTANAAQDAVVTISINGVVWTTKTLQLLGDAETVGLAAYYGVYGKVSTTYSSAFVFNVKDALGRYLTSQALTWTPASSNSSVTPSSATTGASTSASTAGDFACSAIKGSNEIQAYMKNARGTTLYSPKLKVYCVGAAYTFSAALDKAVYAPGEIATLTITAKDSSGNPADDSSTLGATGEEVSIAGAQLTAVTAPSNVDTFTSGTKTYQYIVGSTDGNYVLAVNVPNVDSTAPVAIKYSVKTPSSGAVSNAEVLAAIVKLIASINKQIRALQKSLKR